MADLHSIAANFVNNIEYIRGGWRGKRGGTRGGTSIHFTFCAPPQALPLTEDVFEDLNVPPYVVSSNDALQYPVLPSKRLMPSQRDEYVRAAIDLRLKEFDVAVRAGRG